MRRLGFRADDRREDITNENLVTSEPYGWVMYLLLPSLLGAERDRHEALRELAEATGRQTAALSEQRREVSVAFVSSEVSSALVGAEVADSLDVQAAQIRQVFDISVDDPRWDRVKPLEWDGNFRSRPADPEISPDDPFYDLRQRLVEEAISVVQRRSTSLQHIVDAPPAADSGSSSFSRADRPSY
ncbi:hypothetical protein M569_13155 [Genlisea aurea]|uniref:Uncharacterized protein n=1 Tax=Genlisea aurea TaxID=192259 RepID=S8CB81_9LAMI|nr:hypothetical protein M569_13155 [Genlisea aurea]